MRNTTGKGNVTEVQVAAALLKANHFVWLPLGDGNRADILVEHGSSIKRIQCKTGRIRNGCVTFKTASVHKKREGGYEHRGYDVDYFGVYCPENDKCYLVPLSSTGRGCCYLRIEAPKTCKQDVRWASDFEIRAGIVQQ